VSETAALASTAPRAPNGWPSVWLQGFRGGDSGALEAIYRQHAPAVATLLRRGFSFESEGVQRRFVGYASAFDLQDALHETFRLAFEPRAREGYDGLRPFGPWVAAIARNVVLRDFRRKERAFPRVDVHGTPEEGAVAVQVTVGTGPTGPEAVVASERLRERVRAFVAGLPAADRELVRLRFEEGRSQRDVEALLGVGRQRIRTREAKLRAALLAQLRDLEDDAAALGLSLIWIVAEVWR
jgi:RNA polymerase sigma-70 factor (ECF subfamily)